jgi:hypothetical protein
MEAMKDSCISRQGLVSGVNDRQEDLHESKGSKETFKTVTSLRSTRSFI